VKTLIALFVVIAAPSICVAQIPAWSVSAGYSNFNVAHQHDGVFYSKDGAYVDGDVSWLVSRRPIPLVLGGGLSVSGYHESEDVFTPGSFYPYERLFSDVDLVALEGRAGIPIQLGGGWFVTPRIGGGLLIDTYAIDNPNFTRYHTGAAFEIRPAVQVGYSFGMWSLGAETSYMASWGDFGRLGSMGAEFRIGIFARFKF
jgi:hypothetical protein